MIIFSATPNCISVTGCGSPENDERGNDEGRCNKDDDGEEETDDESLFTELSSTKTNAGKKPSSDSSKVVMATRSCSIS
jgi:hypothetical protein